MQASAQDKLINLISLHLKDPQWWSFPAAERIPWAPTGGRGPGNSKGRRNSCARLGSSCSICTQAWWWKPDLRTQDSQTCRISAQPLKNITTGVWLNVRGNACYTSWNLKVLFCNILFLENWIFLVVSTWRLKWFYYTYNEVNHLSLFSFYICRHIEVGVRGD